MINLYHAKVIEGLRAAAANHSEVAELLRVLNASFPYLGAGDSAFCGEEKDRAYLMAAQDAHWFVSIDVAGME